MTEQRLDALLLPGPREILAAATDVLAMAGDLALAFPEAKEAGAPELSVEDNASVVEDTAPGAAEAPGAGKAQPALAVNPELLTPLLLGPEGRGAWQTWLQSQEPDTELTLAEFVGRLVGTPWANTFLRHRDARRRCEEMLAEWGGETLRNLLGMPLWEIWWHTMNDDLGLAGATSRRPIALLTDTSRVPGCRVPGAVYLCLGSEPARQHYEFLGRVTDSALVLYQERSPLPGDAQVG